MYQFLSDASLQTRLLDGVTQLTQQLPPLWTVRLSFPSKVITFTTVYIWLTAQVHQCKSFAQILLACTAASWCQKIWSVLLMVLLMAFRPNGATGLIKMRSDSCGAFKNDQSPDSISAYCFTASDWEHRFIPSSRCNSYWDLSQRDRPTAESTVHTHTHTHTHTHSERELYIMFNWDSEVLTSLA